MNRYSSFAIVVLLALCLAFGFACTPTATNTNVGQTASPTTTPGPPQSAVADGDWPGYNRTLTSERFSPLNQITTANVASLKQVCTFDLGESGNFQSGIIVVNNSLYVTTDTNTFSIDPATCQQ